MIHQIKKGLNLPIAGSVVQAIKNGPNISTVGLVGDDYIGMRPTMLVDEGDSVRLGQPIFEDKKTPGLIFTAPGSGRVSKIVRGAKRKFESITIELDSENSEKFEAFDSLESVTAEKAREVLVNSGEWTALRARPFSRIPSPESSASSIFVNAMDTNPLAAEPELIIDRHREQFIHGLKVLSIINDGIVYVCTRDDSRIPGSDIPGIRFESFSGPHPSGLVGTHIHMLDPVSANHTVWHLNYQDVIAWGHLFLSGEILTERVIAVGGPSIEKPTLYSTRRGAMVDQLIDGMTKGKNNRIISGSVLCGRQAVDPVNFLGRYHLQVSVLPEGNFKEFMGWQKPGGSKFSVTKAFLGSWLSGKKFDMNTNINGGHRSMVPIGTYERVMPLDVMPTHLLRSMIVGDTESAQKLGVLELDEEDVALCTFVCPGKYDYGTILRDNLTRIEKDG